MPWGPGLSVAVALGGSVRPVLFYTLGKISFEPRVWKENRLTLLGFGSSKLKFKSVNLCVDLRYDNILYNLLNLSIVFRFIGMNTSSQLPGELGPRGSAVASEDNPCFIS